jgi:acyl-CoA thioesterase I
MTETEYTAGSPEYLAQFLHSEKMLGLPSRHRPLDEIADIYPGGGPDALAKVRRRCKERVRGVADEILADSGTVDLVTQLPFARGDRVVAFGDSLTDDLQSWAEILAQLLASVRGDDEIEVLNLGRSDDTTANLVQRFPAVAAEEPAWLIVLVGMNDAKHVRLAPNAPLISDRETRRNVRTITDMATASGAQTLWLVPPEVDLMALRSSEFMAQAPVSWQAEHVAATREALLDACERPLDLQPTFAAGNQGSMRLDDGVHPSLNGQRAIALEVCRRLVSDAHADASAVVKKK